MMTHEELKSKLHKAMGNKVPMSARETWADFIRSQGTSFFVNFDWIKDMRIEQWAEDHPDLECYSYVHGLRIEIWQKHHDKNGRPIGGLKEALSPEEYI